MTDSITKCDILNALNALHAAQQAHDVDAMIAAYATNGFVRLAELRKYFEQLIARDAFRTRTVDMTACETFVHRDIALIKPVIYHTRKGERCFSYHLARQADGVWRIIDNNRSQLHAEQRYSDALVANAGKVVGFRGMLWIRRLDVPVSDVWQAISTKQGLETWWLTRSVEIDLRPGGLFRHHWNNAIRDFKANEFIDFIKVPGDASAPDHLLRLEIKPDGAGTVFSLLDTFEGSTSPLSLPWTASGWHSAVDALEHTLTGRAVTHHFGLGGEFYWSYLRSYHNIADMVSKRAPDNSDAAEWRAAYFSEPL